DSKFRSNNQQIPVPDCLSLKGLLDSSYKPCAADDHQLWLKDITHWRDERRIRIGYNGSRYEIPELLWTQSSFIQPQMMVQDRFFFDPIAEIGRASCRERVQSSAEWGSSIKKNQDAVACCV